jgi:hypothetical protein
VYGVEGRGRGDGGMKEVVAVVAVVVEVEEEEEEEEEEIKGKQLGRIRQPRNKYSLVNEFTWNYSAWVRLTMLRRDGRIKFDDFFHLLMKLEIARLFHHN